VEAEAQGASNFVIPSWARVPRFLTYREHIVPTDGRRVSMFVVETATERSADETARRVTVSSAAYALSGRPVFTDSVEVLIDRRGMQFLTVRSTMDGKEEIKNYDPPLLVAPAEFVDGTSWTFKRRDGRIATVVVTVGSPFCADGFRVTRRWSTDKGWRAWATDHYCPGEGWRGKERVDIWTTGERSWSWTTGLVADGVAWGDPSLEERFPEGGPPD